MSQEDRSSLACYPPSRACETLTKPCVTGVSAMDSEGVKREYDRDSAQRLQLTFYF